MMVPVGMWTYLILGMTYAFAAAVEPGPLQTYLISQTLSHGWRRTTIVLFATARNLGPRVTRVLIGLSSVALACFGCYLLWSGW